MPTFQLCVPGMALQLMCPVRSSRWGARPRVPARPTTRIPDERLYLFHRSGSRQDSSPHPGPTSCGRSATPPASFAHPSPPIQPHVQIGCRMSYCPDADAVDTRFGNRSDGAPASLRPKLPARRPGAVHREARPPRADPRVQKLSSSTMSGRVGRTSRNCSSESTSISMTRD